MEDVSIFYSNLVHFTAIWYTLWTLSIVYGIVVHIFTVWYVAPRKIWQPCSSMTVGDILASSASQAFQRNIRLM
jgi:hypothetical protein